MGILIFCAVIFGLIQLNIFRHEKHDADIIELMRKGEGPDHYITYNGRVYTNIRCIMKKMRKLVAEGKL